mgnify:FL=1
MRAVRGGAPIQAKQYSGACSSFLAPNVSIMHIYLQPEEAGTVVATDIQDQRTFGSVLPAMELCRKDWI